MYILYPAKETNYYIYNIEYDMIISYNYPICVYPTNMYFEYMVMTMLCYESLCSKCDLLASWQNVIQKDA